jgi:dimethylaniline monooxygenase (N-oxide forming)
MSLIIRKRVAVIGAGVAGIVSAKILKHDGFDVTIFEKESFIGGVWAESRAYPGLRTNNPRETYVFSDFPYPENTDDFPTAGQVRGYLNNYAEHFGLKPHLHLSTEVVSVSRRESKNDGSHTGFQVKVKLAGESTKIETYDFNYVIICNGVFSEPYIPQFEGQDQFAGKILHSSQLNDPEIIRGKRVVVVGAGKSALDCATFASQQAASAMLVFRKPHWMIPRYFGKIRVDKVLFNRFSTLIFPSYHRAKKPEKILRTIASPFLLLWRTAVDKVVKYVSEIPDAMVPDVPVTAGLENNGIGAEFYQVLKQGQIGIQRARIASYSGTDKIQLESGEELDADVVIFATGWQQNVGFLDEDLRNIIRKDGWFRLYRHILPPGEKHMGFVGYASSGNAPLTSEISAHWLSQVFRGELSLPDASAMELEIDKVRKWTQKVFPRRNAGYFIGAYIGNYIDELMQDMGLPKRLTGSIFSEYWAPFWATRYRDITKEREEMRKLKFHPPGLPQKTAISG